jgi:NADH-quinone oxidoreductase subunit M
MFNLSVTPLGNLFFGLTLIVFVSLALVNFASFRGSKASDFKNNSSIFLYTLLFISLGVIFYASDLITLFIGWEVMSWSSYFIITNRAKLKTSQKYILFNLGAGFALLGAVVLIYSFTGTALYSDIAFSKVPTALHFPITLLLLITIFIKSGVMPFHHWVVDTYEEADNLFSSVLSAIISKAGIFLFILMFSQIIGYKFLEPMIFDIVAWLGVITSVIATFKAISQDSMKRLLAYSSIAQLGYIVTILSIFSVSGIEAGLYHTLIHTLVKLLLFVNVASIIYITGKNRFSELGGLIYRYPILFIMLLIGIIGLAGMPPLGGFNSKFLIYTTLLEEKKALLLVAVMFSSASAFLYCFKLIYGIYLGQSTDEVTEHKELPTAYYIPQIIGAVILVVLGLLPSVGIAIFNPTLISLGFEPTAYSSLFELNGGFASFNGGAIMTLFILIFVAILSIAFSLKNKIRERRDRFDISYCGETPNPTVNLHYGYGVGEELRRISFIGVILRNSSKEYWERISTIVKDSSTLIKKLYGLTVQNIALLTLLFFTILLFVGVK